ncbi:MAG: class I SAM-dependent methyltransferase [Zoogloeaceae bacterium]|jgi:adenine-specific DNA-methyltransferase|nr:class I SAM-dependent methyltransferase [Zoogloeaceae bacterium]
MTARNVESLGQVFTPPGIVASMLDLCRNNGRILEPSAGDGAFFRNLQREGRECVALEIDSGIAPPGVRIKDFFALSLREKFDTIIGNPPYVRYQDIRPETRARLDSALFDARSNLFLFFIEKCVRHLNPGGELVFIVPREFIKLTAARKLNAWLYQEGSITHFHETGDKKIFGAHVPNCAIFRFEKGRMDRQMADGRRFVEQDGQLMFLRDEYTVPLSALFEVRVGGVSGADDLFTHPDGNREFVCSKTASTGETRRMLYDMPHPHLEMHKERLLARRVRHFDESNWWRWGRAYPLDDRPRIYVNGKTRRPEPFFVHESPHFDGSTLALFPRTPALSRREIPRITWMLNREVNWRELGFVCDGRYLFTQRSLQTCLLPTAFARLFPEESP